jgi:hypothetical protein
MKTQNQSRLLFYTSLSLLSVCLLVGFIMAGQWIWVALAIFVSAGWYYVRRHKDQTLSDLLLVVSIGTAAAVKLAGGTGLLAILSAGLALAVWDLRCLDEALDGKGISRQTRLFETNHLKSWVWPWEQVGYCRSRAVGKMQIPFVLIFILTAATAYGLNRILSILEKKR